MNKIVVIGCSGSGKSTLSRQLGKLMNLSVYHLDAYYWKPGWVPTPNEEWDHLQLEMVKKPDWIIDGNYGRTMDIRISAADTIIFLDMPRLLCTYRVLKRRIMYHGRTRPDLSKDCPEQMEWQFIKWVWKFPRDKRPGILQKITAYSEVKRIVILRTPAEVKRFLDEQGKVTK